jgi:hypothetical protein
VAGSGVEDHGHRPLAVELHIEVIDASFPTEYVCLALDPPTHPFQPPDEILEIP